MKKELTANPFSLLTTPKSEIIDINKVIIKKHFEKDVIFEKKYINFIEGKINGYFTRMSLSKVKIGFYKYKKNWKYYVDKVSNDDIDYFMNIIKGGYKMPLYIYLNPNKICNFDYVCPDDVALYKAYLKLNIKIVPVIILEKYKELEESALIIKGGFSEKDKSVFIYKSKKVNKETFPILTFNVSNNISLKLKYLYEKMNKLKDDYRRFHLSGQLEIHYHNVIFSILIRVIEHIESIQILVKKELYLPISGIIRSLYELTLSFYIFWLCPSILSIAQLASSLSRDEFKNFLIEKDKDVKEEFVNAINYQYTLIDSVIEKASFSPFGEKFYNSVYSFYSKIVHHDFSVSARYKSTLLFGDEVVYNEDIKENISLIIDVCITLIYIKCSNEIGITIE